MSILRWKNKVMCADGGVLRDSGGGGGGAPVQQTVSQTNIPEYARPYVETMLGQAQALTDVNQNPYKPYEGQRVAGFTPMQAEAYNRIASQQAAPQLGEASNLASQVGSTALGAFGQGQQIGQAALGYGAAGAQYGATGAQEGINRANITAAQAKAFGELGSGFGSTAAGLAPTAQAYGQESADIGLGGLNYGALGVAYGLRGVNAAEQAFGAGQQFARESTDPYSVAAYMSPYMQNVVEFQKQQARRDADIANQQIAARAVTQGAFGGSRQAVAQAEANRTLQNQLAGIQALGTQKAFEDAQRQMQFGADLGLRGIGVGYQGLQTGMQGANVGLAGIGTALQGQQARLAALNQAGQLYGLGMQGAQVGLQGVGAQQAAANLALAGTAQGMQGAQIGLQGTQGAINAGQYGLAGLGIAGQSASTLGALGQSQFQQEAAINQAIAAAGAQQQAQQQRAIDIEYQNYMESKNYPYRQLGFMSDMLRGLPLTETSKSMYEAQPGFGQQALGLGLGAVGAAKALG